MRTVLGFALACVLGFAGAGCTLSPPRVPLDPAANFAAHIDWRGIVVDRMADGQQGMLVANATFFSHKPPFVLEEGEKDVAAFWPKGTDCVVREPAGKDADRPIGDVKADWKDGAIRLTFRPNDHEVLHTGAFHRLERWGTPESLGQPALTILDLPGIYIAEVRNTANSPVGWMRVEIGRYGPVLRVYDGKLPASINGPLAVAAVKRLDSEIDWVEQHAINPYVGN